MQIAQTDEQFHEIIYNSTKNQKLVQILNNLREQMYRYRLEYIKDADKRQILMVEHEHIFKGTDAAPYPGGEDGCAGTHRQSGDHDSQESEGAGK